jgi:hypothetical protein
LRNYLDYYHNSRPLVIGEELAISTRGRSADEGGASQFLKSSGCIIVTDEPLDVSDPVGSVLISIKSMEGRRRGLRSMRMVAEATRRRRELES